VAEKLENQLRLAWSNHREKETISIMNCLHYFPMRAFVFSVVTLLSIVDLDRLQATEPQFRPVLVGNDPKALVNLIDSKKLMEKGERDALLMFSCRVSRSGQAGGPNIPRQTPGSKLLEDELRFALGKCRFIPAIYNGERTDVTFSGTVLFMVSDGKPHLRIYANQSRDDVNKGNDFIAPQVVEDTVDYAGIK
jgi:hypothetical protein